MKQFYDVYSLLGSLPERMVQFVYPLAKRLFQIRSDITSNIRENRDRLSDGEKSDSRHTIIHNLLQSKLPPQELSDKRLTEEAFTLLGAGTITTAYAVSILTYHILASPSIRSRLTSELEEAEQRAGARPTWQQLEQLPYLSAVVTEGLRLSYGVSHRLPRISPDEDLDIHGHRIPAGTPVSMTQMFIHNDPYIFERPLAFSPERWLGEDVPRLRKYWMPFSRGTRSCVGMNLAYAEIYLTLASLFRPGAPSLHLFETGKRDVEVAHDFFNPSPPLDSSGVRVLVT